MIKIKLTIAGQDLEVSPAQARELKDVLDKLFPTISPLHQYQQPMPSCHHPAPSPLHPVTCDGPTLLDKSNGARKYHPLPPNISPLAGSWFGVSP